MLCLVCGFEGRYASRESRDRDLARLKDEILALLQESGRDDTAAFHKGNVEPREYIPEKGFPVWGTMLAGLMLVGVLLVGFKLALSAQGSSNEMASIWTLGARVPTYTPLPEAIPAPPPPAPAAPPAWVELLRAFCARNQLECEIEASRAIITLGGEGVFASAAAELPEAMLERLRGLGTILDKSTGDLTVEGHTDRKQMRSFRWQNNLELSGARAETVAKLIRSEMSQPSRVQARGFGELQPRCRRIPPTATRATVGW